MEHLDNGSGPLRHGPIFDMRITFGAVIQIAVFIVSLVWFSAGANGRITALENQAVQHQVQLSSIEAKLDTANSKITDLAYQVGVNDQRTKDEIRKQEDNRR